MALSRLFKLREKETPGILDLLDSVTLGTNGAQYRHLDTRERIKEIDNPLYLSMERNEKVIGNITFCRRGSDWYIRYFAFSSLVQSGGKKKSKSGKNSLLKRELSQFFDDAFNGEYSDLPVSSFYAYIDPLNAKSLWMSENFSFKTVGKVATQTFSRINPKPVKEIEKINDWSKVSEIINSSFGEYRFFTTVQTQKPPFYVLKDENSNEIIALAKINKASWQIKRLPGRFGGTMVKLLPWIPVIRKLIKPEKHTFIVPEAVWVKENSPELLSRLFEGILSAEKLNLMIWWVDKTDPLYENVKQKVKWGLMDKIIGVSEANIVVLENPSHLNRERNSPHYTSGIDFI